MATYVNDLRLKEIGTGESSGTWGTETNVNLELIGDAMGLASKNIANASTATITMPDGTATNGELRSLYLKVTGGGQACTVTLAPNTINKVWFVENNTAAALSMSQGSGANVSIAAGQTKAIATNGVGGAAAVFEVFDDLAVAGDLHVASTLNVLGDTSAGDKAALGYAAADGVILTGQGGTNDVTIKNDADATVMVVPTGTTTANFSGVVDVAGDLTAGTLNADGATSAGDNATIGYTSALGLVLTGQGSTNDVTIKNDADAAVLQIPTGTTNATFAGTLGVAGGSTNGVVLSQGDIALKNGGTRSTLKFYCESNNAHYAQLQAPAHSAFDGNKTLTLPAVTDTLAGIAATQTLTNKTLTTPVLTTPIANAGIQLKNAASSAGFIEFFEDSDNGANKVTLIGPAATADITLTLPSSTGSNGQVLITNGSGVLSFATVGGAYSDWAVLTSATTLANKGQYVSNKSTALTHTLPAGSAGNTIILKATGGGTITIARNGSQKINSVAADGTLSSGNAVQLVYTDDTIGWLEL